MKRIRWLSLGGVFALVMSMTAGCAVGPTQPVPTFVPRITPTPQAGEVYTVKRGTLSETLEARGRVVASQEELLFFPLGGFVKTLDVQAGDPVQAGQVVAELDAASLEDQLLDAEYLLQQAQGDLAQAKTVSETLQLQIDGLDIQMNGLDIQIQQQRATDNREVVVARGELNIANAEMDNCEAVLAGYQKAVPQAETEVRRAQLDFEKVRYLWDENEKNKRTGEAIPPAGYTSAVARLEAATLALDQAQARVTAQQAECEGKKADISLKKGEVSYYTQIQGLEVQRLETARRGLEKEKARLEKEKEINALTIQTAEDAVQYRQTVVDRRQQRLAQTELNAPFDGVIVSVEKQVGDQLEPYEPLGAVADPSVFRVEATVLEEDILNVSVGQVANITLDAYPSNAFQAAVSEIGTGPTVWQGKNAYTVYLEFTDPDQVPASIRMGADINIQVMAKEDVLLAPESAIVRHGTQAFVTRVNGDGGLEQVEVELGVSDGRWVEVLAGLTEGQEIQIP